MNLKNLTIRTIIKKYYKYFVMAIVLLGLRHVNTSRKWNLTHQTGLSSNTIFLDKSAPFAMIRVNSEGFRSFYNEIKDLTMHRIRNSGLEVNTETARRVEQNVAARVYLHLQASKASSSVTSRNFSDNSPSEEIQGLNLDDERDEALMSEEKVKEVVDQVFDSAFHWGVNYEFQWNEGKVVPKSTTNYARVTRTGSSEFVPVRAQRTENLHLARGTSTISDVFLTTEDLPGSSSALVPENKSSISDDDKVVAGLGNLVANEYNRSLLGKLVKNKYFEQSAKIIHQEVADNLNARISDVSEIIPEGQIFFNDPVIIKKLSQYIKTFEVIEILSTKDYKVNFTGELNPKALNSFGNTVQSNTVGKDRDYVKNKLVDVNAAKHTFDDVLSAESVLELDLFKDCHNDKTQLISKLTEVVDNFNAYPRTTQENEGRLTLGQKKTDLGRLTYETQIDSDHVIRTPLRTFLQQRLLNGKASNDNSLAVELPIAVHKKKEASTDFKEGDTITYDSGSGLSPFLDNVETSIGVAIDECSPSELYNVPAEVYKNAYANCIKAKKAEMTSRYPELNQGELLKIYHAHALIATDQYTLDTVYESCEYSPVLLAQIKNL